MANCCGIKNNKSCQDGRLEKCAVRGTPFPRTSLSLIIFLQHPVLGCFITNLYPEKSENLPKGPKGNGTWRCVFRERISPPAPRAGPLCRLHCYTNSNDFTQNLLDFTLRQSVVSREPQLHRRTGGRTRERLTGNCKCNV